MQTQLEHFLFIVRTVLLVVVVAAIGIGALFWRSNVQADSQQGISAAVAAPTFAPDVNPLTGLRVDESVVLQRRPIAVKISNGPAIVRPQAGIADADLVFEHITEGSITRFTAIYWTHTPPRVGSIRSARLIDLEVATMYKALFSFAGASEGVRNKVFALYGDRAFEGVSVGTPTYYRDDSIEPPHNLFTDPSALWALATKRGVNQPEPLSGMQFSDSVPSNLDSLAHLANAIAIDYGPTTAQWLYDAGSGRYMRWTDDGADKLVPHVDANNGQQVSAANVVILRAWHQEDLNIVESEWQGVKSYSIEIQLWTLGPALVCREGRCIRGQWNRWDKTDMLTFWTEADHQPIYLKPGNTWFQVVNLPDAPKMQQQIDIR